MFHPLGLATAVLMGAETLDPWSFFFVPDHVNTFLVRWRRPAHSTPCGLSSQHLV